MPAGVHAPGRVQHLQTFRADGDVTVAGKWGCGRSERKTRSTTDAVFIDTMREVALVRQVAVILPRLLRREQERRGSDVVERA